MRRPASLVILCGCFAASVYCQTAGLPLWAYGYIAPAAAPVDYSTKCVGDRPSDGAFTVAQINYRYGPADWFPNDHPPMPDIVAHGKEANGSRACAICHLPNGKGLMQN